MNQFFFPVAVIMPILQDQFQAADRIEHMGLGPAGLELKILFPLKSSSDRTYIIENSTSAPDCTTVSPSDLYTESAAQAKTGRMYVSTAVSQSLKRIRFVSAPSHRFRCACYGRDLRLDQGENGLRNCTAAILEALEEKAKGTTASREVMGQGEGAWQEFPCGLQLATHTEAPEETNFLYDEIFVLKGYMKHGIWVREGDLVIDVGEIKSRLYYDFFLIFRA